MKLESTPRAINNNSEIVIKWTQLRVENVVQNIHVTWFYRRDMKALWKLLHSANVSLQVTYEKLHTFDGDDDGGDVGRSHF